jgi:putative membrane-bound dehydrogenase-like protein
MILSPLEKQKLRFHGGAAAPPYLPLVGRTRRSAVTSTPILASGAFNSFLLALSVFAFGNHTLPAQQFDRGQEPPPLPPGESARAFTVPDDLEIEVVLSEPLIAQPLHLTFDERGRLWVVEYRQYPEPAGLTQVSHDRFWRSVYDRVPPPPPNHFVGKDRVSIHEDTDGDGRFDAHKVFVDGLNIATSIALGRGGVWVLNPPYLLFYPDRNRDDVPDGDPEVHLSGFGLEDTHSVANSLRWGPDGWLYACQGSTVSGSVKVEPLPNDRAPVSTNVIHTLGQNIWRYHPETRRYEVFSEGGGNAFGIEIDSAGRLFSGHNGGDTRGFHYVQGAYLQKGFQKHGELSNPYAFGYFPQMANNRVERFTHTFLIYEADALPERYRGKLFGIEPLQGRVVLSEINPVASTFATRDLEHVVTTTDRWFRPVDIKLGPDGAIYLADWHDFSINHWKNYQGNMDAASGRVWRLKAKGAKPPGKLDLAKQSDAQLIESLGHASRWWREAATIALIERANAGLLPALSERVGNSTGALALNALWTWQALGARTGTATDPTPFLRHADPQVRLWATRFIGDPFPGALDSGAPISGSAGSDAPERRARLVAPKPGEGGRDAPHLIALAESEPNLEVRVQLAATAKRLPAEVSLPIIQALARRDEDAADPRQPLMLWWALEAKAATDRDSVLRLFADAALWDRPLVKQHLLERVMRRYAQAGTREDLLTSAKLLDLSPSKAHSEILMRGFEEAFKGRSVAGLPDELITAMARHGVGSVAVGLRRSDPQALEEALKVIASREAPAGQRRQYIQVLGEVRAPEAVPVLLELLASETDDALLQATLVALQPFTQPGIAATAIDRLPKLAPGARAAGQQGQRGRESSARQLLTAVESGKVATDLVPAEFVRAMKGVAGDSAQAAIDRHWPNAGRPSSAEMETEIVRLRQALAEGHGDPYNGKRLYTAACASCHRMFNQGGDIGPDLTSFNRRDENNLLLAIVNPSAEVREGYENFSVETRDERALSGFIVEQDERRVILRGFDGQNVVLPRAEIATLEAAGMSLMPEGLTTGLDDQQVRDLFAYLRSSQPLNE